MRVVIFCNKDDDDDMIFCLLYSASAMTCVVGLTRLYYPNVTVIYIRNLLVIIVWWRFGAVGSDVGRINEVTLRRARLVLGWVTVSGFNSRSGKFISI